MCFNINLVAVRPPADLWVSCVNYIVVPNVSVPDPELVQQVNFTLIQLNTEFDEILKNCRDLCDQPVSVCESNLELLIADVSPTGQYGEVEDQNEEVSIAENNRSFSKGSLTYVSMSKL